MADILKKIQKGIEQAQQTVQKIIQALQPKAKPAPQLAQLPPQKASPLFLAPTGGMSIAPEKIFTPETKKEKSKTPETVLVTATKATTTSTPLDWTDYYRRVLENPTATPEAKEEARRKLGLTGTIPTQTKTATSEVTTPDPLQEYKTQLMNLIRAYKKASETSPPQKGLTPEERAIYEQTTEELKKRYQKALEDLERKHQQEQQRLIARYAAAGFSEPGIVEGPMAGVPGIVTRALQELREAQAREITGLKQAEAEDILAAQQALAEAERRAREEEYERWAKEQQRKLESLLKQAGLYETIYELTAPKREIIGDRIYEYDPITRTYKDVTPEEVKRAQIEGAWQTGIKDDIVYRFNPLTGEFQVIATLPTKDKVKQVIQDPGTGRYLIIRESGKIEDTGITGIPKAKISEGQAKLQSTLQIIKQVRTLLDRIGLADTPAAALIRGPQLEMESKLKINPDAAAYKSLVEGTLSFVIKSLGEAGTLSAQDVARARKLLPTFYDTKASAEQKLNELETLINSILTTQTMMMGGASNISTEDEWEWVP